MSAVDRRTAAGIVEQALAEVFDAAVVGRLREDSPLAVLGMEPADAVCVADAAARAAGAFGCTCALGDDDLVGASTVADLVAAVGAAARPAGTA